MSKCCSEIVKAMATASSVAGVARGSRRHAPNMTHCPLQTGWPKASFMPGGAYLGGIGPFHCYPGSFPCHTHPGWLRCWVVKPNKCLHSSRCTWHCMTVPLPSAPLAHVAPVLGRRAFEGLPQQKENAPSTVLLLFSGTIKNIFLGQNNLFYLLDNFRVFPKGSSLPSLTVYFLSVAMQRVPESKSVPKSAHVKPCARSCHPKVTWICK